MSAKKTPKIDHLVKATLFEEGAKEVNETVEELDLSKMKPADKVLLIKAIIDSCTEDECGDVCEDVIEICEEKMEEMGEEEGGEESE